MTFRSKFGRGLVAAMEDEALAADLAEVDTGADSAEAAIAEVTELGEDLSSASAEIESVSSDAETLELIADKIEATEESGGLTPEAAEVVEVAVESIYARLGLPTKKALPALEGFSNKDSRVKATHIAVEDIREMGKRLWEAIKKAFNQMIDWIVSFWKSLTDATVRIEKRAKALQVAANAVKKGAVPKSGTISGAGWFTKLSGYIKAGDGGAVIWGDITTSLNNITNAKAVLAKQAGDIDPAKYVSDKGAYDSFKLNTAKGEKSDESASEGMEWRSIAVLGGNRSLILQVPSTDVAGDAAWSAAKQTKVKVIATTKDRDEAAGDAEIRTLTVDQISDTATQAIDILLYIRAKSGMVDAVEKGMKKFVKGVDAAAKAASADNEAAERGKNVAAGGRAVYSAEIALLNTGYASLVNVTKAALDYAEKSVKQYESVPKA